MRRAVSPGFWPDDVDLFDIENDRLDRMLEARDRLKEPRPDDWRWWSPDIDDGDAP